MKRMLIGLVVLSTLSLALAQEHLPREEALKYAFYITVDLKKLQGTPIPTDVDVKHPVAMREGDYGAMVLPECKLTVQKLKNAGDKLVPVGQLWLHRLTPVREGEGVQASKLRVHHVEGENESGEVVQLALGVKKNGAGVLELQLFGKDATPLLAVPMKEASYQKKDPIEMNAERGDEEGRITLKFLGQYQATIPVTEFQSW